MLFPGTLHAHTHYSNNRIKDAIIKETELIDYAIELGHSCVAITEHDSISSHPSALKYYKKIKEKNPDFKLILGNEIYLCRNELTAETFETGVDSYWHFILLAKDAIGHKQLREISTRAWMRSYVSRGMRRVPTYYSDLEEIIGANPGHIYASSACLGGFAASKALEIVNLELRKDYAEAARKEQDLIEWIEYIKSIVGKNNFFLEIQPPAEKGNDQYLANYKLLKLAKETETKWIPTTDSHYLTKDDAFAHETFLKSQEGEREVKEFYATTYMMSTEELESHFDFSLDEGYAAIAAIANSCEDYTLNKPLKIPSLIWKEFAPKSKIEDWYAVMPYLQTFYESPHKSDRELAKAVVQKLEQDERLRDSKIYEELNDNLRITWESSEVNKARWSAYFLNLQKIIDVIWEAGSLVGPARGSATGFLLMYILDIIQINPVWETTKTYSFRFLNPSRVSVLDVDCDIESARRGLVLDYFKEVYGQNRVSGVATFGKETSKAAIISAARGLGYDPEIGQYLSSLVPSDRGKIRSLSQCMYGDKEEGFPPVAAFVREMNDNYSDIWEVAKKIEGVISRIGCHAGGIIFKDEDFTESISLMRAPSGEVITSFDLHAVEDCGE